MPISMMTLKNIKNGVSNQRLNQFIVVLIMSGSAAFQGCWIQEHEHATPASD
jgi:hypothetical protein